MRTALIATILIAAAVTQSALPAPDAKFDPGRDAAADIQNALAEARTSNRRVILDVGGEWCGWCHALDHYFVEHADLREFREKHYVWLKVNYSPENRNERALARYGEIIAYPWLFVLDQDGTMLVSQRTGPLEDGTSYDSEKMRAFLARWVKH
ncbi:MAG TPA: thioredoxin family protein [Vicinamibacterales bacterium]|nr:thioredoxin family protein [Vicinamibacterales bacterium]